MPPFSNYAKKPVDGVLVEFKVERIQGLSVEEAASRLLSYGPNEITAHAVSMGEVFRRQFTSPFIYLLGAAAVLALWLGKYIDAVMIMLFVVINTLIGFYQEYRSEQTLQLLKRYVVRRTRVRRSGSEHTLSAQELVLGDIVMLAPGDIVPADIRLIEENNLIVDESSLTGESVPIKKITKALTRDDVDIFNSSNIVFSGTTIVSGSCMGVVCATGRETVMGEISRMTVETQHTSGFIKALSSFSSFIVRLVVVTLLCVVAANIFIKGIDNIPDLLIFAIALAVSVIPEALPVVMTFSLSRGALQLARHHVIVKRLSAIEDLGSIEILCTDKTGTLTENILSVAEVYGDNERKAIFYAALGASDITEERQLPNNAFDRALWNALASEERVHVAQFKKLEEIPFDPHRRRNSIVVESRNERVLIVRGAPEEIVKLLKTTSQAEKSRLEHWISERGAVGQRVFAIAEKTIAKYNQGTLESEEHGLTFVGCVAFHDPLKKTTKDAVRRARALGISVKILTGDSPEVAAYVGKEVGLLENSSDVITGSYFASLSASQQYETARSKAVFSRVTPQQKFEIVSMLKRDAEVGFLGEGINDAPALKAAHVGLVVAGASDIAVEAADIVLLKKSLAVIVNGIQEGRRVFVNTIKYIKATLASNFGNFFAVAIASLLIPFLPLLPLQILLINLLSDFPMIAIAADTVDTVELKEPKSYNVKEILTIAMLLGVVSTVFDFIFFALFYSISPGVLQTNWFIASIITELAFLFSIRTRLPIWKAQRPSHVLLWLSVGALIITVALPFIPITREIFDFIVPAQNHIILILAIVSIYFIITESVKNFYYGRFSTETGSSSRYGKA